MKFEGYSFVYAEVLDSGVPFPAGSITEATWGIDIEQEDLTGNSPVPVSKTPGTVKFDGSLTLYLAPWATWVEQQGPGFALKPRDIVLSFRDKPTSKMVTITYLGVTLGKIDSSASGGAAVTVKVPLHPLGILVNGIDITGAQGL